MNKLSFFLISFFIFGSSFSVHSSLSSNSAKPNTFKNEKEQRLLMIGKWYGKKLFKGGGTQQWVIERFNDGTYRIDFKYIKKDGSVKMTSEVGYWGISWPVYFSIFRAWVVKDKFKQSDPSDPHNYDAYQIIQLNDKIFEYKHYRTGIRYKAEKVASDFQFK